MKKIGFTAIGITWLICMYTSFEYAEKRHGSPIPLIAMFLITGAVFLFKDKILSFIGKSDSDEALLYAVTKMLDREFQILEYFLRLNLDASDGVVYFINKAIRSSGPEYSSKFLDEINTGFLDFENDHIAEKKILKFVEGICIYLEKSSIPSIELKLFYNAHKGEIHEFLIQNKAA